MSGGRFRPICRHRARRYNSSLMLSFLLAISTATGAAASERGTACEIARVHTSMLLNEVKNFDGSEHITFVGGNHMPYNGTRESWFVDKRPARPPPAALLSKVKDSVSPSSMPSCKALATFIAHRGLGFVQAVPQRPVPSLAISVSLPVVSNDGQLAILLDSVGSAEGGGSGRVCYYRLTGASNWARAGCSGAWIAD